MVRGDRGGIPEALLAELASQSELRVHVGVASLEGGHRKRASPGVWRFSSRKKGAKSTPGHSLELCLKTWCQAKSVIVSDGAV